MEVSPKGKKVVVENDRNPAPENKVPEKKQWWLRLYVAGQPPRS